MYDLTMIGVIAFVTLLTRALPFLVFKNQENRIVEYLGHVLPFAIMAMLVVYCLKGVNLLSGDHGISEIIAVSSVILIHIYKRNTLLSILCGTIIYMLCVQMIFV